MINPPLYPTQDLPSQALASEVELRLNSRVIREQDMRGKWGSCPSAETVSFVGDIANQNQRFQDFRIAHKLLHWWMSSDLNSAHRKETHTCSIVQFHTCHSGR